MVRYRGRQSGGRLGGQDGVTLMELLVAMVIMSVISTMIIVAWVALQNSYAYSVKSDDARDTARDTLSRMRREIRDAMVDASGNGPVVLADANHIEIMTAFHDPSESVQLVDYTYTQATGQITRRRGTGTASAVAKNVVNTATTPIFTYGYYDSTGDFVTSTSVSGTDLTRIQTIEIHLLVDLNPGHSPTYMSLESTVQPRNQRQY
jgi:prepilin-type N-terminal cleavage/methylation domain-containing protein